MHREAVGTANPGAHTQRGDSRRISLIELCLRRGGARSKDASITASGDSGLTENDVAIDYGIAYAATQLGAIEWRIFALAVQRLGCDAPVLGRIEHA